MILTTIPLQIKLAIVKSNEQVMSLHMCIWIISQRWARMFPSMSNIKISDGFPPFPLFSLHYWLLKLSAIQRQKFIYLDYEVPVQFFLWVLLDIAAQCKGSAEFSERCYPPLLHWHGSVQCHAGVPVSIPFMQYRKWAHLRSQGLLGLTGLSTLPSEHSCTAGGPVSLHLLHKARSSPAQSGSHFTVVVQVCPLRWRNNSNSYRVEIFFTYP